MDFKTPALLAGALLLSACSSGGVGPFVPSSYAITMQYVEHFYPRWFTYEQSKIVAANTLIGPDHMNQLYGAVVAPNDDTLYGSTFIDARTQPVVFTIPATTVTYSLLTVDLYGDIFKTGITGPGTYALTAPGWSGTLPAGVTPIAVPVAVSVWIIRADKFSAAGVDQSAAAELFRDSLRAAALSDYQQNPALGKIQIVPVADFGVRYKSIADGLIRVDPIGFLKQLQAAVAAPQTAPLSTSEQQLSDSFNALFGSGNGDTENFSAGARDAHQAIVDFYTQHTGSTNWIGFTDIGTGSGFSSDLERSAIAEYIQYANGHSTSGYYQTFKDGGGAALDGSVSGYVLTFTAAQIPQAARFWSVTAYTPDSITLIKNAAGVYKVASYTPGLVKQTNGSVSIYMAPTLPAGVPAANWLPIPSGPFNIMLRVYGPEGSVAAGTYVPPAVQKR